MKLFMQLSLCVLAALCISLKLFAQAVQMRVEGADAAKVFLEDLKVDVKVTGSIAATTWTMSFRNNSSRLLEGELTFPLAEGITVSRYAIDINGKLRDAVPVDKVKGTTVLEAIEQRRVDPGLLERVDGNAFRTRIYPLPAGGTRTVVIGYEELLRAKGSKLEYRLPLSFKQEVQKLTIAVSSFQAGRPEAARGSIADMNFTQQGTSWAGTKVIGNFSAEQPFVLRIPQAKEPTVLMQAKGKDYYCLINMPPRTGSRERTLPNEITIMWDASLSGLRRPHEAELELLDGYIRRVANATINLVVFSNAVQPMRSFAVKNGDWHLLREMLEGLAYDGGTQFSKLDLKKLPGREFLLFSDGLATYGTGFILAGRAPVYCINAAAHADYSALRNLSARTGGQFIDLTQHATRGALEQLINQPLMLLGIRRDIDIEEAYPNVPVIAASGAAITAICDVKKVDITLQYGYGTVITEERTIALDADRDAAPGVDLGGIWAAQKIAALDAHYEQNKAAIESLGKSFGLVTRNTSLIVLENISDYLSYGIQPPPELRDEYDRIIKERGQQRAAAIQNRLATAESAASMLADWWNRRMDDDHPQPASANGTINKVASPGSAVVVHATRAYTAPIIDPENPGGRSVKTAERIERAPTQNVSGIAALSTSVYENGSSQGLHIAGSRSTGTKYIIDGVQIAPGSSFLNAGYESAAGNFIDEGAPLFGIGERNRRRRKEDAVMEELAITAKFARLSDSVLFDSLYSMPEDLQYATYLGLRPARLQNPSFYFQAAAHFFAINRKEIGLRILSNLAELELENYELYKMLGYKLREIGETDASLEAFRKVLAWRPMDPQSRRDYGLALADAGFYSDAIDTLYSALTTDIDPSLQRADAGIEETILCDINGIAAQHSDAMALVPPKILKQLPSDIRVVINWNMKSTDIDLWVTDPKNEKCFYSHNKTAIGGRMSADITQGFGPEQFLLRNALPGHYKVEVNYYGDRQVKIAGPTTVMAEIYTGWGKPHQKRQIITLQMKPNISGGVLIGEFDFGRQL